MYWEVYRQYVDKSTINDGGLVLSLPMVSINYGILSLSLSMTCINNDGLVKTFKISFDKHMLGVYFYDLGFLLVYLNLATLLCKIIKDKRYFEFERLFFLRFF